MPYCLYGDRGLDGAELVKGKVKKVVSEYLISNLVDVFERRIYWEAIKQILSVSQTVWMLLTFHTSIFVLFKQIIIFVVIKKCVVVTENNCSVVKWILYQKQKKVLIIVLFKIGLQLISRS